MTACRRRSRIAVGLLYLPSCVCLALASVACAATPQPDYSKEAAVVQKFNKDIAVSSDGTSVIDQSAVIRVQSDAGVRQYGVLRFYYDHDNTEVQIAYVRVRKPDGSIVTTPESSVQDLSSEVQRLAPSYSDLREKQVPVSGLSPGDVLEYRVRFQQTKAEVPGQFWDAENFLSGAAVLEETLQISIPAAKYLKVVSQSVKPEVHEESGQKIYLWKTSQLKPSSDKQEAKGEPKVPDVQVTTFKSWDEVGRWYGKLVAERAIVTPAIRAKAAELTKGLTTVSEKRKAIYDYVSTQFRYISISFGIGRYQPHFAAQVLANQYGDCKDKHTLFAALLKAAGIEAWPALIGAGTKIDPNVPSPAQFNHVITVVPDPKGPIWLDTTPGVAPYGWLQPPLRGKQALVIPASGAAHLATTPADPPFPSSEIIAANGSLASDGTLKAHFEVTLRGDAEVIFRAIFRRVPASKWQFVAQKIMDSTNLSDGTVSNLSVSSPEDLEPPLHYSYDYVRKNYIDEAKHRFILPMFPYSFSDSDKKPDKPVVLPSPGQIVYRATVQLPEGFSVKLPPAVDLHTEFASYHASYTVAGGVLSAERRLTFAESKLPLSAWDKYHKFVKQISDDEDEYVDFSAASNLAPPKLSAQAKAPSGNAQAAALVEKAYASIKAKDLNAARDELDEAERLNPKQPHLWWTRAGLLFREHDLSGAFDALQKEVEYHPKEVPARLSLAGLQSYFGHQDDAIETLRVAAKLAPDDISVDTTLSRFLLQAKRYKEVIDLLREPVTKNPGNQSLLYTLAEALLRDGQKKEGLADVQKLATKFTGSMILNNAAFLLADTSTDLPLARQYAQKAVSQIEGASKQTTLSSLKDEDLGRVTMLAAAWDTLGWAYFQSGDTANARKYISASWLLSQDGTVADHLGEIYAKEGKKTQAIHVWQLALAANGRLKDVRKRLENLGVPTGPTPGELLRQASQGHPATGPSKGGAELSQLRTTKIPGIPKQQASAEFFLLFSASKVEGAQFISGSDKLKSAVSDLLKAHYKMPFPDQGPEKVVRRGILSCSRDSSPSCEFVFLLPSTARK